MTQTVRNPYTAPIPHSVTAAHDRRGHRLTSLGFPLWVCIGLSGALLGMIAGPFGMMVGGVLAFGSAAVIVPLLILVVGMTYGTTMTRGGLIAVGGGCGALSGITSTLVLFGAAGGGLVFAAIAAGIGGLGGMLAASFTDRSSAKDWADNTNGDSRWE